MIDDKLREILGGDNPSGSTDWAIAQIKQAFEDEGYIQMPEIREIEGKVELQHTPKGINPFMTGQEWYERFEKELMEATKYWLFHSFDRQKVLEAAERASKLNKEGQGE